MVTPDGSLSPAPQAEHRTNKTVTFNRDWSKDRSSTDSKDPRKSADSNKEQDELSPLIIPAREDFESPPSFINVQSPRSSDGWDVESEETKSSFYLFLLTLAIGG